MRNFGRGMWRRVEFEKPPEFKESQYLALLEYYRLKQLQDKQRRDYINNYREQILKTANSEIMVNNEQTEEIIDIPNVKEIIAVELEIPSELETNEEPENVLEEIKSVKIVVFEDDKLTKEEPVIEEPVKKPKKGRRKNNK